MLEFLLEKFISPINNFMWTYVLIVLLLGGGFYFTLRSKFVQIVNIKEMFRLLKKESHPHKKQISSLQAFFIGAASRIGVGNIAGVALAISIGGPGAVFWMWVVALLGGASAFVESTLAQIYKIKDSDGNFKGGPSYYIQKQLGQRQMGIGFSICLIITFGFAFNSSQSNTIAASLSAYQINPILIGLVLSILTLILIIGGVQRIAHATSIIVPIMAFLYIGIGLYVVVLNITQIPGLIVLIVKSAFGLEQFMGATFGTVLIQGVKRGLFSNEAGMGSAPNAAAAAFVSHPAKQGFIQTLGVYFDTLVVCSITAFIILLAPNYMSGLKGIELTQVSLTSLIGGWAHEFLVVAIFFFAFSSILGNYFYGEVNVKYISERPIVLYLYRAGVIAMIFIGSVASLDFVWTFADLSMAFMATINLIAIILLSPIAFKALKNYVVQRKSGIDPVFYADDIPGLKGVECWKKRNPNI